ncbi:hypothetical protein JXE04_02450 [Patescibacteria group bacterium]|nr:hypothetical protein [Patescibacteria group bacterium]
MQDKDKTKKELDLNKYEDLEGITLNKMNFGLWLSLNRKRIWRIVTILLIVVSALMFIYSTYNYIYYFLYGRQADKDLASEITSNQLDTAVYRENNTPQDLEVGAVLIFSVQGKYDILVPLNNINTKHSGSFDFCLQDSGGVDLICDHSFILPDSKKYLIIVGKEFAARPQSLKMVVKNIFWQRLNAHNIPDWNEYKNNYLNLTISDLKYTAPDTLSKNPFHSLSFKATNFSPYHFSKLPLDIILHNGALISGVNVYNLDNFLSGEQRELNFSWPAAGERVSRVEILPDVNILDARVYLPYQGEVQP